MDYQKTVRILVGPEENVFTAPESLLVEKSDLFRAACTKPWKEAVEGTVRLPGISREQFNDYLTWVYKDVVASPFPPDKGINDHDDDRWDLYTDHWITGNRLGDTKYRNSAVTALMKLGWDCIWGPNRDVINKTWEHVGDKSPMRGLLVDSYVSYQDHVSIVPRHKFDQDFME